MHHAQRPPSAARRGDLLLLAASLLVLVLCLIYPFASQVPDLGFTLIPATWEVIGMRPCAPGVDCPQTGDRVLAIGELTFERYRRDRMLKLLAPFAGDRRAEVRLLRGGVERTVEVRLGDATVRRRVSGLLLALLPLGFWLMGTALVLFLRPRDERWWVLVLFSHVTALLLASGLASASHAAGSAVVFHVVVWLFLPLAVHLHLLLPTPLFGRWRSPVLVLLYAASLVLVVLDARRQLAAFEYLYVGSFIAGVGLSLGLLGLRLLLPAAPASRVATRIMAFGVAAGFAPIVACFFVLPLLAAAGGAPSVSGLLAPTALAVSLLAMPVLPLSYLYAIYKHRLSALEFRANRLLGVFGFHALWAPAYALILLYLSHRWAPVSGPLLTATLLVSLAFLAATPALRDRFHLLVDRHVFGIKHTAAEVIELVSARLPAAFDRSTLARVVAGEILPALLVRQSALFLFEGDEVDALYEQGVPEAETPRDAATLRAMLARGGTYLPPRPGLPGGPFGWVRLVLPLAHQDRTIGAWLLGRRDPDDHFPASDIHLLATVANQIATMLENVRLYERAQQEIGQRKAAEEEIRTGQLQLLHAQKMEAIGRLSAGIAHDFNNCLLVILGSADLLLSNHSPEPARASHLVAIQEAGRRAAGLMRELLAFARRQPMEAEVVDVNQVVQALQTMLRSLIGDDVALVVDLHPALGKVRVDPGRMEQVLLNLAVNARHAMPRGGTLTVRTAPLAVALGDPPPHPGVPAGRWLVVTVRDTGTGMDLETQARVFEPFFSTRKPGDGTGLGLSTAYGTVKQSGGHITVDSAPGEGACFTIYLPEVDEEPPPQAVEVLPATLRGSETVLVVDDDQAVRQVVVKLLRSLGYGVMVAGSGPEGLALTRNVVGPLDLLLTDLSMPEMGGRELAHLLRELRPATRVLYMSGQPAEVAPEEDALFMQKPFTAAEFGRAVRAALEARSVRP